METECSRLDLAAFPVVARFLSATLSVVILGVIAAHLVAATI